MRLKKHRDVTDREAGKQTLTLMREAMRHRLVTIFDVWICSNTLQYRKVCDSVFVTLQASYAHLLCGHAEGHPDKGGT